MKEEESTDKRDCGFEFEVPKFNRSNIINLPKIP